MWTRQRVEPDVHDAGGNQACFHVPSLRPVGQSDRAQSLTLQGPANEMRSAHQRPLTHSARGAAMRLGAGAALRPVVADDPTLVVFAKRASTALARRRD